MTYKNAFRTIPMPSTVLQQENVLELIGDMSFSGLLGHILSLCAKQTNRNVHIENAFKIRNQDPSNTLRVLGEYSLTLARARILKSPNTNAKI